MRFFHFNVDSIDIKMNFDWSWELIFDNLNLLQLSRIVFYDIKVFENSRRASQRIRKQIRKKKQSNTTKSSSSKQVFSLFFFDNESALSFFETTSRGTSLKPKITTSRGTSLEPKITQVLVSNISSASTLFNNFKVNVSIKSNIKLFFGKRQTILKKYFVFRITDDILFFENMTMHKKNDNNWSISKRECVDCHKKFVKLENLRRHQQARCQKKIKVKKPSTKRFSCLGCNRKYAQRSHLYRHQRKGFAECEQHLSPMHLGRVVSQIEVSGSPMSSIESLKRNRSSLSEIETETENSKKRIRV